MALKRPAPQRGHGRSLPVGGFGRGGQGLGQFGQGQAGLGAAAAPVVLSNAGPALQSKEGLELADDFPAGGLGIEALPEQAPEGAPAGVVAVAAVCMVRRLGKEPGGLPGAQTRFQLAEGVGAHLTKDLGGAGTQGGQAGKKGVFGLGRYLYRPIDSGARLWCMATPKKTSLAQWEIQYAQLRRRLTATGWISEGYVQDRGPGAGGPCYQWTRKVKGKTVSVALSKEQFEWLQGAIANWRELRATLKEMQRLSRRVLFETVPEPPRRKKLGKKVLGLI